MKKISDLAVFRARTARPQPPRFFVFHFFFILIFFCSAQQTRAQSPEGFISVDCGLAGNFSYQDSSTRVNYTGDSQYIATGENHTVSQDPLAQPYGTLRSFPKGTRNCYKLSPVQPGKKYLVRAGFYYGNFDGQSAAPTFDLHLGVDFWTNVGMRSDGAFVTEIIIVARRNNIQVCLVNTGGGTPFISVLELRPLPEFMYPFANASQSLIKEERWNYGIARELRYPDDPYDRIWEGVTNDFLLLNTTRQVLLKTGDAFQVPQKVLQTAISYSKTNFHLTSRAVSGSPGDRVYIVMHFAELVNLNPANESRQLNIFGVDGGVLLFANYSPPYLTADHKEILNAALGTTGFYNISIYVTNSSTHSYMINGLESFFVRQMNESETDDSDVSAMEDVKRAFRLTRNWEADPCSPRQYTWAGVGCTYEGSATARIISLNLSSSGLEGGIPSSIGNLTALTSLDLSNNNLTGPIPDTLGELPSLQFLDLSGNKAIGSIPPNICAKVSKGVISASGGLEQCKNSGKNRRKIIIPVTVAASVMIILFIVFLWAFKRMRKTSSSSENKQLKFVRPTEGDNALSRDVRFTYAEITNITQNFQKEIGHGGFGTVFFGTLNDKTKVAVKVISSSSSQGPREFQSEILLLARVHHKNLVRLLGYCDEVQYLSLVYEYMNNGTLQDHLSGKNGDDHTLNWNQRVSIALQAAQGLDYLHNGCRPQIIHRDIKSSNILLNSELVAKIADFGLSRAFSNDNATHITTGLAGTPGYLDPEYCLNYRLNEKSDVYSFGIVLLEILTGQPPYQKSGDMVHIVKWIQTRIQNGDIRNIVDSRLKGDFDINMAWKIVEVAMACTSTASYERITMSNVVMQLKQCFDMNEQSSELEKVQKSLQFSTDTNLSEYSSLSAPSVR